MSEIYELNCPHCDRAYRLTREKIEQNAGKQIKCRACGQPFVLPGVESAEVEPDPSAVAPTDPAWTPPAPAEIAPTESEMSPGEPATAEHPDADASVVPPVEPDSDAPPAPAARPSSPIAPAPTSPPLAEPVSRSPAAPTTQTPSPVDRTTPSQASDDFAMIRRSISRCSVLLAVMVILQLISTGALLWIAVRLFR